MLPESHGDIYHVNPMLLLDLMMFGIWEPAHKVDYTTTGDQSRPNLAGDHQPQD